MKKLLGLLLIPTIACAQHGLSTPIPFAGYDFLDRKSVYSHTDLIEEGSFLFPQQATPAYIKLKNGRQYSHLMAMLNLMDNELLFQDSLGQIYSAIIPIDSVAFELSETNTRKAVFKTGYPAVDGMGETNFYEVLSQGKLTLLKAYKVSYTDRTSIERSMPIRRYETKEVLYIYSKEKGMRKLSKSKKEVLETLTDKSQQVLEYESQHKTNFKSDDDLAMLFTFYNTL